MSLIDADKSLEEIKSTLISTLVRAGSDRKSPFRSIIFNTISDSFPNSRYVVLRKFDAESNELFIYTDARSNKVGEINENPFVSILTYDKQKKCQIKLKGKAHIHREDAVSKVHWSSLHGGKESYNTRNSPGKVVDSLEEAQKLKPEIDDEYFVVLRLEISDAEVLQLNGDGHIRVKFNFLEDSSSYLTP